jgi:microcystin-dependent protein
MARNGSGTYTKVNTFVASATITASGHNQNWDDIASEITNSVAADGQTTMTGPLKASNGSVTNPSLTFGSDQNTGLYRIGADNLGVAANGAKVVDVATTGVTVTGDLAASGDINATGVIKQAGNILLPVGLGPLPWSGTAAPDGWVLANGQTLLRADYPDLWAFAATEIGLGNLLFTNGNGTTTFTVADMGGRTPAGVEASASRLTSTYFGGDSTIIGTGAGGQSRTLLTANLPAYTPSGTVAQSSFTFTAGSNYNVTGSSFGVSTIAASGLGSTVTLASQTFTGVAQGGTSTAFGIVQPTIITNFIIFAGA